MSSGIISKIRLEPFYQQFLRGFYKNNDTVFKFPREDADELALARKFNQLLMPPPNGYKIHNDDEYTFLIEVPYQAEKSAFYFNYISLRRNTIFVEAIEKAYRFHFHEKMMEYRNQGYSYKQCAELFIDEYNINCLYIDRAIKDFQRWKIAISVKKYRQKSHLQNRAFCPGM
jgi:hypothetical protein